MAKKKEYIATRSALVGISLTVGLLTMAINEWVFPFLASLLVFFITRKRQKE